MPPFYIDRTEVTQKDYLKLIGRNPSFFKGVAKPVEKVNWFEAQVFCKKSGKRLPSESEWEVVARAGTFTPYYWGSKMDNRFAWFFDNSNKQTQEVGRKRPNQFGLFDMAGNVWEWTASDHESDGKVLRGGSWRIRAFSLRSSHRIGSMPNFRYHYVDFRCARSTKNSNKM